MMNCNVEVCTKINPVLPKVLFLSFFFLIIAIEMKLRHIARKKNSLGFHKANRTAV